MDSFLKSEPDLKIPIQIDISRVIGNVTLIPTAYIVHNEWILPVWRDRYATLTRRGDSYFSDPTLGTQFGWGTLRQLSPQPENPIPQEPELETRILVSFF